jgi:hypothetical protein
LRSALGDVHEIVGESISGLRSILEGIKQFQSSPPDNAANVPKSEEPPPQAESHPS